MRTDTPRPLRLRTRRFGSPLLLSVLIFPLAGCTRAPLFNILGSYFPAWMLCMLIAILLTVVVRIAVRRFGVEEHLEPLVMTYPCLAACFACSCWLLFFD